MKRKINKIAALFIVSIFALSGTGIAFAAWFDTITIEGTVDTGSLCWQFTSATIEDDNQPINFGGDYPTDYLMNLGGSFDLDVEVVQWNEYPYIHPPIID